MESEPRWYVAHTRPRAEKKVAEHGAREGWSPALPLYRSVKRYRGKRLVFLKPLFPGYVFLRVQREQAAAVRRLDHVANLLEPGDQVEFASQLADILRAVEEEVDVRLVPEVQVGQPVRIRSGPLRGLEGMVVERSGEMEVILRLDFIGQAAAVRVAADEVERL